MSIRLKLLLSAATAIILALAIGILLFTTFSQLSEVQTKTQIINEILKNTVALHSLTYDYLLHPEQRAREQWQHQHQAITFALNRSEFKESEEKVVLEKLRLDNQDIKSLFTQFQESSASSQLRERLVAQVSIKIQEVNTDALSLADIVRINSQAAAERAGVIVSVFVIILTILMGGIILITNFTIALPLAKLTKITKNIAEGQLDISIDPHMLSSHDEIGELTRSFNEMMLRLKESYHGLEEKVRERTAILEETKAKDEALLASIGDGLVVVDKAGKILMVNNAFENLVGWKGKEVLGKLLVEVVPREDESHNIVPFNERILTKVLSTTTTTTTWYYIRKDKTRFLAASIITPFIVEGKILGAVELFRDVTKEKEIDKAKSEFVSLASHQLRTPLSTVRWYAEMLLSGDAGKITDDQKKYLDEIYAGNKRMIDLVNALLNVSRIEMGTFVVEPVLTDIVALSKDLVKELEPDIFKNKQDVNENYSPDIPKISVDPKLIRMVLQNLLRNAIKYTPEKGTINLSLKKDEDNLLISVADTGFGIPKSQQNKIFTKLFRADNVRERETTGTGLGLYIVKAIVEQSDGKIWFKSTENKGTIFYVSLPLSGMQVKSGTKALD